MKIEIADGVPDVDGDRTMGVPRGAVLTQVPLVI